MRTQGLSSSRACVDTCKEDRAFGQRLKNYVVVLPEVMKQCVEWQIVLEELSKGQITRY